MAQDSLSNFSRELPKEASCEIISKSVHRFSRSRLKLFSIYSPGGYFVERSGTIWAILVEGQQRDISVKLFQNLYTGSAAEVVKSLFLLIVLTAILFNVAESFELILVEAYRRNIPV